MLKITSRIAGVLASAALVLSLSTAQVAAAAPQRSAAEQAAAATAAEFQLVVFPDTQKWTANGETRFANATNWIAANAKRDNTRYVLHTGDVTNWGWLAPSQFEIARSAMDKVRQAGIPYQLSIGNHDTRAVGWNGVAGSREYGGAAYVDNPECVERYGKERCKTELLIRYTDAFKKYFTAESSGENGGRFTRSKIDNSYSTFKAGGRNWLTLTLEMAPRAVVVDWAAKVVQQYPNHNVIVQTHSYLNGDGSVTGHNSGYGATTGTYLYNNLIRKYANIRLVFSGHTGVEATRVDRGVNGNTIISMLQNDVTGNTGNAMRLVKINGATGKVTTRIYAPNQNKYYTQYDKTWTIGLR